MLFSLLKLYFQENNFFEVTNEKAERILQLNNAKFFKKCKDKRIEEKKVSSNNKKTRIKTTLNKYLSWGWV